jgi:hypothetical protein
MGSGAVIYVPSFIKIGSGIQKLMGGGGRYVDTHTDSKVISQAYLYFFQNKENRLITACVLCH